MNNLSKLAYYLIVIGLLLTQTVLAKETELSSKIQGCAKISQDTVRLTCFDQLTNKDSGTPVEPEITYLTAKQVDSFSKEQVKKTSEELAKEINSITLTISKLTKTLHGQWKIIFENGQKWQQKDTVRLTLKQGDKVILTKGALSSVFLQKEKTNKRIRVKRLK